MLRTVLTSIGIAFFVVIGLLMISTGDTSTRMTGFVSVFFFGGLGSLAFIQAVLKRFRRPSLGLAFFGITYLAGCSLFLGLNADMFGEQGDVLTNPAVIHGFGFGGFALLTACLLSLSISLGYRRYTRSLPRTAEEAIRRWQDQQVVTREWMLASLEQMNGQIQCLSPFYFDIRGPGEPANVLIDEWVEARKPEWFNTFLEVIAHPPPSPYELWQEQWQDSMAQLLAAWVAHDPDRLFPQLSGVTQEETARPVLLQAFATIAGLASVGGVPERREQIALWLKPWQEKAATLSEMEREWLDEAATFCVPSVLPN